MQTTPPAAAPSLTANAAHVRKVSGTIEIDPRSGFECCVRAAIDNALTSYRDASKARAAGDEQEAYELVELAEQSIDLARELLCRIEGLE